MRGLVVMMVMALRKSVVHIGSQYTNAKRIWQAEMPDCWRKVEMSPFLLWADRTALGIDTKLAPVIYHDYNVFTK
jgi:hypothetical protein